VYLLVRGANPRQTRWPVPRSSTPTSHLDASDWRSAPASYFGDEDDGPFILLVRPRRMIAPLTLPESYAVGL